METNEELIKEARAWNEEHLRDYNYTSCTPFCPGEKHEHGLVGAERLIARLADALEAATEPEWEYQRGDPAGIRDDTFNGFDHYETFEEAKVEMDQDNDYPYSRVVRRRKAGSWLPIEGEGA